MAAHFERLTQHLVHVANIKWLHSVADDFFTKQLPFNVTWVLTLMYAMDQGHVANDPRAQVLALPLVHPPPFLSPRLSSTHPPPPPPPPPPPFLPGVVHLASSLLCNDNNPNYDYHDNELGIFHASQLVMGFLWHECMSTCTQGTCDKLKAVNISTQNSSA